MEPLYCSSPVEENQNKWFRTRKNESFRANEMDKANSRCEFCCFNGETRKGRCMKCNRLIVSPSLRKIRMSKPGTIEKIERCKRKSKSANISAIDEPDQKKVKTDDNSLTYNNNQTSSTVQEAEKSNETGNRIAKEDSQSETSVELNKGSNKKIEIDDNSLTFNDNNPNISSVYEDEKPRETGNLIAKEDPRESEKSLLEINKDAAIDPEETRDSVVWQEGGLNGTFDLGVACRWVRVDAFRVMPYGRALFSSKGIVMKMPTLSILETGSTKLVALTVAREDILKLELNQSGQFWLMNISLSSSAVASLCETILSDDGDESSLAVDGNNFVAIRAVELTDVVKNDLQKILSTYPGYTTITTATTLKLPVIPQSVGKLPNSVVRNPKKFSPMVHMFNWADGFSINTDDYKRLNHKSFLNDSVIDFYLSYLLKADANKSRCHVFSSFFYQQLSSQNGVKSDAEKKHSRVKMWTKKIDIFEKDYLFIPINECSHWYLAIVCFPGLTKPVSNRPVSNINEPVNPLKAITDANDECDNTLIVEENYLDSIKEPIKQQCILICDSMSGSDYDTVFDTLRNYLQIEYRAKKGPQPAEPALFTRKSMVGSRLLVPQQTNSWDCGVYLLLYVEAFLKKPLIDYRLPLPNLLDWFSPCFANWKRRYIQFLMIRLTRTLNPDNADSILKSVRAPNNKVPLCSGWKVFPVELNSAQAIQTYCVDRKIVRGNNGRSVLLRHDKSCCTSV